MKRSRPTVVAFGGGHGLAASLAALRQLPVDLTAVVTVADDGGSSGRMRQELAALPPGDLRMALATLAGDDAWGHMWARLVQHRFGGSGPLAGHAVGNLMLTGLIDLLADPVEALDLLGKLLGATGRVLPMCCEPLDIVAEVLGLDPADPGRVQEVRGQVQVATTTGRVCGVRLVPAEPVACPAAVEAVLDADLLVLGPGSWFTSVLPHLLVPDLAKAITTSPARTVVTLNIAPQLGETTGFSAESYLEVLALHAPELEVDVVLADPSTVTGDGERAGDAERRLAAVIHDAGAELLIWPVADGDSARHHPARLAEAYRAILFASAKGDG